MPLILCDSRIKLTTKVERRQKKGKQLVGFGQVFTNNCPLSLCFVDRSVVSLDGLVSFLKRPV